MSALLTPQEFVLVTEKCGWSEEVLVWVSNLA